MNAHDFEGKFARVGARVRVEEGALRRSGGGGVSLDVQEDGRGEVFTIQTRSGDLRMEIVDLRPRERHLLLLVEEDGLKQKFLCGHDERHWFVAAVPEVSGVRDVPSAMEALKPAEVRAAQERKRVRNRDRSRRRNEAYVRQGEWFFVPAPDLVVDEKTVFRNEALSRGAGSKPHVAEFCYRHSGTTLYVCDQFRGGVGEDQYRRMLRTVEGCRNWNWEVRRRDATVYVKGRVSHADHKTIVLACWHRVLMNTENQSVAMRHVAFLD
jgi:hypothetical protein